MPKMTLLEMVQDILNDMDSDSVNNVTDTLESQQVTQIIKTTYYNLVNEYGVEGHQTTFQLEAFGDVTKPTKMKLPDSVVELFWIRYNKLDDVSDPKNYTEVQYLSPESFIDQVNGRDSSETRSEVVTVDTDGTEIIVYNNANPTYWTSFDGSLIWMDSYNSDVESSLQKSKTQAFGTKEPTWSGTNTFVPELPANLFPLFLSEAKTHCFAKLKAEVNQKEEQRFQRNRVRSQTLKYRNAEARLLPSIDYGRPTRK